MFMYLFRGEMTNRTLHFWLLAPVRREVLLLTAFVLWIAIRADRRIQISYGTET